VLNYGKCTNIGICNKANTNELILIVDPKFKCPECDDELSFAAPKESSILQKALPIALIVCIMGLGGFWMLNSKKIDPASDQVAKTTNSKTQPSEKAKDYTKTAEADAFKKTNYQLSAKAEQLSVRSKPAEP
jgi:hypothetical protein